MSTASAKLNAVSLWSPEPSPEIEIIEPGPRMSGPCLADVIDAYQVDPLSSFHKQRFHVRKNHRNLLRRIRDRHGRTPLASITGRTLVEWHADWMGGGKVAIAHSFIAQLRTVFGFGFTLLSDPQSERLSHVLSKMKFPMAAGGSARMTAEQADAVRMWAHIIGWHSIGMAQAIAFEGTARSSTGSEQESSIPKVADSSPAVLTTNAPVAELVEATALNSGNTAGSNPAGGTTYTLDELLKGATSENIHPEFAAPAVRSAAISAEPVAWQFRTLDDRWNECGRPTYEDVIKLGADRFRGLYAAPTPSPDANALPVLSKCVGYRWSEIGMQVAPRPQEMEWVRISEITVALASSAPVEGWRDIETAPKDGQFILAIQAGDRGDGKNYTPDTIYWDGAWLSGMTDGMYFEPTHWMPIPPSPQSRHDRGSEAR